MESAAAELGSGPARDSGLYGIRVDVNPQVVEERSLGSFDTVDSEGNLSVVSVAEQIHGTSSEGIKAVSYRFDSREAGRLSPRSIWSFISFLSSALIAMVAIYGLLEPDVDLGYPRWVYYAFLFPIFFLSKFLEVRKISRASKLVVSSSAVARLRELYGAAPLIDLPGGRLQQIQRDIETTLQSIPTSKLAQLKVGGSLRIAGALTDERRPNRG